MFAGTVAISVAIGLATGFLAARIIGRVDDHLVELTITVVLAYGSYMLADAFHLSGVIATVTAAIVLGNVGPGRAMTATGADAIDTVWEFFAYLLTAVVFLLVGLAIPPGRLLESLGPIAWAIAGILIGRAIVVYLLLGGASRLARRSGPGRTSPERLAPRAVLGRSARGGGRGDGALPAGRRPAAGAAPGDHLRGRPVHAARPGDDRRLGRRPDDRTRSADGSSTATLRRAGCDGAD